MNVETLTPIATSVGGGFFIGILIGYFVKKIIKVIMFVTRGIVGLLLYLQSQQIISVNLDKLEESSTFSTLMGSTFDNIAQIGNTTSLGIPMAGGLSAGFAIGLMKG